MDGAGSDLFKNSELWPYRYRKIRLFGYDYSSLQQTLRDWHTGYIENYQNLH